ncbi:hypothetical protein ACQ4PT_058394 [Festuca glaucescens]
MINASKSEKTLVLFVDHTNFLKGLREDVIVRPRNAPSPVERSAPSAAEASTSSTVLVAEKETMQNIQSDDSDSDDFEFYDSDFDAEDGDDDIFADNVDKSVNDNNDKELCDEHEDEDALEDDDLNLREEDRKHLKKKFTAFNPEIDMDNPSFKRGMKFSGVDELRKALTTYSIRNRVKIKKLKNDKRRIQAVCAPGCPWMLKASNDKRRTGGFVITAYEGTHKCEGSFPVKSITSKILTEKFMHEFRDNQKLDLKSFAAKVLREYKMCPERWKLSKARKDALLQIHGDEEGQFRLLMDYGQELRRSNPGSKFFLTTNSVNDPQSPDYKEHLATVYWSYDACKRGFLAGCRPFICIDGCHIKTKYKGVLLTAVGIDPNDCIYPVAFGLAEVECTSSWEWFLTNLRDDLNISNTSPWTIMSDKQKGLINAVQKVFPDAEHRFCVRHIIQNFQRAGHRGETLKNDIWAIARSTSVPKWHRSMEKLKVDSETAYAWIEELAPNTWVKAFFSDFPKCDMLLNNHSEVFNSYILEAREMPFLSMLETIFYKLLQRNETKEREAKKWSGRICPKIKKKLDKFIEWSNECSVSPAGNFLYSVSSHEFEKDYSVDFNARTCDCKRWQLTGIPCHHVIACCRKDRIDPENLVHSCYTIDTFNKAYAYKLAPLRGRAFWENMNAVPIQPPLFTKVMGRPKKNRKKAPEEKIKKGVKVFTKAGVTIHCSICGIADHNKKGHEKYLESIAEQIQNNIVGEDDEIDIPSIVEHVIPHTPNPSMDPTQKQDSMVYRMQVEDGEHVPINRLLGPLPENAFVASARDNIPHSRVRVTTASSRGNLRGGRGRGRTISPREQATSNAAAHQGNTSTCRGKGKKRSVQATGTGNTHFPDAPCAVRGRRAVGRGRGANELPDLNVEIFQDHEAQEVPLSQNAPADEDI